MGYTEDCYKDYLKRMETFSERYNKNSNEAVEHATAGFNEKSCARRYVEIHGAVVLMGGWANCSYWIRNHARNYFETCSKLEKLVNQAINHVKDKDDREKLKEKLLCILREDKREDV